MLASFVKCFSDDAAATGGTKLTDVTRTNHRSSDHVPQRYTVMLRVRLGKNIWTGTSTRTMSDALDEGIREIMQAWLTGTERSIPIGFSGSHLSFCLLD